MTPQEYYDEASAYIAQNAIDISKLPLKFGPGFDREVKLIDLNLKWALLNAALALYSRNDKTFGYQGPDHGQTSCNCRS